MQIENKSKIVGGILYDKFIGSKIIEEYEVLTHKGWVDIQGVGETVLYKEYIIRTTTKEIVCADKHILVKARNIDFDNRSCDADEIYAMDLVPGDMLLTVEGVEEVIEVIETENSSNMFDLQIDHGSDNLYFINDILSHNSMWMQNIATNVANAGYNVLYVSLEMSEKKVVKRIGSMRLGIPIREYDSLSRDTEYIRDQLENLKRSIGGQDLFESKIGKIYIKEFPCNTLTPAALDAYIDRLEKLTGNKIHLLVIDYLTIMTTDRRLVIENNLYMRGKNLAEGVRGIAQKKALAALTATQLSKEKWGANDIELKDVPESKAIVETADTMWGIIRNPVMKVNKLYQLKALKLRDAEFIYDRIQYTFDTEFLKINEQQIVNDNNL